MSKSKNTIIRDPERIAILSAIYMQYPTIKEVITETKTITKTYNIDGSLFETDIEFITKTQVFKRGE